ncbi:TIR domain-containing protein [Marivirga sericea]|uniref:TIR domain-containing protein n=1 Tax=Marivirga sericea TaxID=1028 RepID=A0A1X7I6T0_9BACT|nr:TIR domain-containing protein [Marivirga sericea]SMG10295.1 TIR domain-containing protein [Marivirga sericea]
MSILSKKREINRLIKSFESEADQYHDIDFHIYTINQSQSTINRKFRRPNHGIMLWQYIGELGSDKALTEFTENLQDSDLKWGVRGAKLTKYGIIEGQGTIQFLKMAKRAGSLFSESETMKFKSRVFQEIQDDELRKNPKSKPTVATNDNPLAIWLNYLLYFISKNNPYRQYSTKIEPDLFTLSLLALEKMVEDETPNKSDKSSTKLTDINFKVAVSFPGEKRRYVSSVVDNLRAQLGKDKIFYDFDYQAQIARPNADVLLQDIYHKQSELIVVFLCQEYSQKDWCGLEWRGVRDLIKAKEDDKIMFVRFDNAEIDGAFSIDGYIDGNIFQPKEVASFIIERINIL